jgi:hypothetical protein
MKNRLCTAGFAMLLAASGAWAQLPPTVDCSVNGQRATCSREALAKRFAEAKTVAVDSTPRSKSGEALLKSNMIQLGKQIVPAGTPADITLRLVQTSPDGVDVGAGDSERAMLQVFSSKTGQAQQMLWVERYLGHAETPWPSMVQVMAQHFQATLAGE